MINTCILTHRQQRCCLKQKGLKASKMKTRSLHTNCKSIAQMGGFMPSNWLAINSEISYDRTPELCQGSRRTVV